MDYLPDGKFSDSSEILRCGLAFNFFFFWPANVKIGRSYVFKKMQEMLLGFYYYFFLKYDLLYQSEMIQNCILSFMPVMSVFLELSCTWFPLFSSSLFARLCRHKMCSFQDDFLNTVCQVLKFTADRTAGQELVAVDSCLNNIALLHQAPGVFSIEFWCSNQQTCGRKARVISINISGWN